MKNKDLIAVCIQNLYRHKARTMLTVLGVVIGCCSVIIMISLGIGMREAQEKVLSQMGDLTIITVTPTGKNIKAPKLTDRVLNEIRGIKEVEAATPKLTAENADLTAYAGTGRRYRASGPAVIGMDIDAAEKMGYKLVQGSWDPKGPYRVWVGQSFAYSFEDTKRPEGKNMIDPYEGQGGDDGMEEPDSDGENPGGELSDADLPSGRVKPYFDVMSTPLALEAGDGKEDGKRFTKRLEVSGRLKEDFGKGEETYMGIIMRVQDLQSILDQQSALAGKKKNRKEGYSSALVKVFKIEDVGKTEKKIARMGFRTNSMESIRKPMEKEARQKQMMLGGLGAVSLFVAALGIINTMIMSISERTREIGVMKSLGCYVRDVRRLFLMEAGGIGFIGGIIGTLVSLVISVFMNLASAQQPITSFHTVFSILLEKGGRISVIPWWLAVFAIFFSILIGVGAGYYPANKAVKISALEAIKHD